MNAALARAEASRLAALEGAIERGLETFVEVGEALREIRDSELYRADHLTFEDYCRERWGISRSYAHRTIEAADVTAALPIDNRPANEAQARELVRLDDPGAREKAWREAASRAEQEGRRVTASDVRAAVAARLPSSQPRKKQKPPAPKPADAESHDPEPKQAPSTPSSPAEKVGDFASRFQRLPSLLGALDVEKATRARPEDVEEWLTAFSVARDAIDELIERTQVAVREREDAQVEADRLGIELR